MQLLISWTLIGVFSTSTILLSIFISWRTCCHKKSSPETTEVEENSGNVLPSFARNQDRVAETEPEHVENIELTPARNQCLAVGSNIYDDIELTRTVTVNNLGGPRNHSPSLPEVRAGWF